MSEDNKDHQFESIPTNPLRRPTKNEPAAKTAHRSSGDDRRRPNGDKGRSWMRYALLMTAAAALSFAVSLMVADRGQSPAKKELRSDSTAVDNAHRPARRLIKGTDRRPAWADTLNIDHVLRSR